MFFKISTYIFLSSNFYIIFLVNTFQYITNFFFYTFCIYLMFFIISNLN